MRHRLSIRDASILMAVMAVVAYATFAIDIFANEDHVTIHQETIELDEALLLGVLLGIGLLVFAYRRYVEQKRETDRRRAAEQRARELSLQDSLTGLPNRRRFDEALAIAIDSPPRAGASHGVLLIDLNGFKQINDVHGHAAGDQVLIDVSERLLQVVRGGDIVARFGGDEFAILAHHLADPDVAASIALRVIELLREPILIGSDAHIVGAGIGIALIPSDADDAGEALRRADIALYRAKEERRSALRFFESEMDRRVHERDQMTRDLRSAIRDGQIALAFRPTYDLASGIVMAFEAEPRWTHSEFGAVPRERFTAVADEAGMVHDLFEGTLRSACAAAQSWPAHVGLSIDLHPILLRDRDLVARIGAIIDAAGFAPSRLEIEITESALVADVDAARVALQALRVAGIRVALDNFGTGYSSLYHLRTFKLDKIKIDRSFVQSMTTEQESASIVNALVGLGQGLGLAVAADGLGSDADIAALNASGCHIGQGDGLCGFVSAEASSTLFSCKKPARLRA